MVTEPNYTDILEARIREAVDIAEMGCFDGAHHKQWVIDQMVRALLPEKEYKLWRKQFIEKVDCFSGGTEEYDHWDEGIAP